jgi:hypothetical protein
MRAIGSTLLVLYGAGLPLLFVFVLRRFSREMYSDQLLRVRGEGESSVTNPHIHIRRRFRKVWVCCCLCPLY